MVDSEIDLIRPIISDNTPLIPELNDVILYYVRLLYNGQYKRGELRHIPINTTFIFMLNITIISARESVISYEGDVDVVRTKGALNCRFNFKFTNNGIHYEMIDGDLWNGVVCDSIMFSYGLSSQDDTMFLPRVTLRPHKFEN